MNSKKIPNVYEISKEIQEQQQKKYALEAKLIANAYREVQQIKVNKNTNDMKNELPSNNNSTKNKGTSLFAMKIKETLKEVNANRIKEIQIISQKDQSYRSKQIHSVQNQLSKLQKTAVIKLISILSVICSQKQKLVFKKLNFICFTQIERQNRLIRNWQINRIFFGWRDQILLIKIQKQKTSKQSHARQIQANELASQFRKFHLIKTCLRSWAIIAKQERKKKIYQKELLKIQIEQQLEIKKQISKPESKPERKKKNQNSELQQKLRGFLDGLKDKVENNSRLKTIKQKTEESDLRIKVVIPEDEKEHEKSGDEDYDENDQQQTQNDGISHTAVNNENKQVQNVEQKRPLTNEQLQKKRRQFQNKFKSRKENLQRLRKEKEDKKRQEEQQRIEIEKQIEIQQRKIKQQKYKQFVKSKQEQEQWQKRQKMLTKQADQFNRIRLLKYYGWLPICHLKLVKSSNCQHLTKTLTLILLRLHLQTFQKHLQIVADQILGQSYTKMKNLFNKKLLKKSIISFKNQMASQVELKQELQIRHDVFSLKIFFIQWKSTLPCLALQNFQWEKPRNKRAEQFRKCNLIQKALRALQQNKENQQKEKNIALHKDKIKNKLKNLLEEEVSINFEEFL